ncbi:MAG: RNA polymerase subunit sigma [Bdellovibrio sp.]|nr:MAG: RNA polymerase subunit sigma [Bdellovibrio sp.]
MKKSSRSTSPKKKKKAVKAKTAPKNADERKPRPSPPGTAKRVKAEVLTDHQEVSDATDVISGEDLSWEAPLPQEVDNQEVDKQEPTSGESRLPALNSSKALSPSDPVMLYMQEIRQYPLLSREQEFSLAKRYFETKDPAAAQALVTSNLRFVVKVAAEYAKFGARMIDLIQEGNMGLMHAVREFNPYKGVRLITYAVWWIRGYIQEYMLKQYSMVKIATTTNQKRLFYRLQKEKQALDAMGEEPTPALISQRMGIPEDEVKLMEQRLSSRDVSLDQPLDPDSPARLSDLHRAEEVSLDERLAHNEEIAILKEKIEELRPELSSREKIILEERLLSDEPLTLQEIGDKYGITREAVRQMETRVMRKLKEKVNLKE